MPAAQQYNCPPTADSSSSYRLTNLERKVDGVADRVNDLKIEVIEKISEINSSLHKMQVTLDAQYIRSQEEAKDYDSLKSQLDSQKSQLDTHSFWKVTIVIGLAGFLVGIGGLAVAIFRLGL
ncbi:MAG: hypothetical protein P4N41_24500 [Negativicutes bacterium]|nr:hypothetical protein [Negativicutes bacterium]MDR3592832.1 hypothetical protein [Negativicutes bacterium]